MLSGLHSAASSARLHAVAAPLAGMDGLSPAAPSPEAPVLPLRFSKVLNHPSAPAPGAAAGYLLHQSVPRAPSGSGLCSKSFVSGFNPSRAAIQSSLSARLSAALALPVGSFTRPHPALLTSSAPPVPPLPPQPSQMHIDFPLSLPLASFPSRPLSHQILPPSVVGWPILATF